MIAQKSIQRIHFAIGLHGKYTDQIEWSVQCEQHSRA